MLAYIVRRLAIGCLTLLLITFLVYGIVRLMPGTPLTADPAKMDPSLQVTPEYRAKMERYYGLDKPWYQPYFVWLGNIVRFDFGVSISQNNQPVFKLIMDRAPATLMLSVTSLILTYLLSIPIGLWATVNSGTLARAHRQHVAVHALFAAGVRGGAVSADAVCRQARNGCRCSA